MASPTPIPTTVLTQIKADLISGALSVDNFYSLLSSAGYGYADIGNQIVTCSFPTGTTVQNFLAQNAVDLKEQLMGSLLDFAPRISTISRGRELTALTPRVRQALEW